MKLTQRSFLMQTAAAVTSALLLMTATPALAQDYPPPPRFALGQLENLVSRIALYPDPLLAQVLAASTFPDQIPEAARWADQSRNLRGDELANAVSQANLPWDPSVQALIPFPTVLDTMASDMNWTSELGNAVLAQRPDVMDAVQVMRRRAESYGYLRSNERIRVLATSSAVEILPVDPGFVCVPVYDPYIVYAAPRPGFFVGGAIGYGYGFSIGTAFGGWGWGGGFNWYNHAVIVNNAPWGRTWYNRGTYVSNYSNWNGGRWQNTYSNRNVAINNVNVNRVNNDAVYRNQNVNRYNNGYSNNGGYSNNNSQSSYRGSQQAPVMTNRGYGNNGYSNNSGYNSQTVYQGSQPAQVTPNRGYQRNGYSNNNSGSSQTVYQGSQQAPVTPSRGYGRNGYSNNGASSQTVHQSSQPSVVTPNRGYQPSYSNNNGYNSQNSYRGSQQAQVAPSRSGGFQGSNNSQVQQNSGGQGRENRGGGRR
jgi:hypothetical protein